MAGTENHRLDPGTWDAEALMELGRAYQPAAIYLAAAELEVFAPLAQRAWSGSELARHLDVHARGLIMLLDALAALGLVNKEGTSYRLANGMAEFLTPQGSQSVLALAWHQANCLRRWAQLARVVKSGQPAPREPSVRGEEADAEAFIAAMDNVSAPVADEVIQALAPFQFNHLLDVGGASGTWTAAFLRAAPQARATLFDLPHVIPMAEKKLKAAGLAERVQLVAGDYLQDALPAGADLAWVSAIVHQHSRSENRGLFKRVWQALAPGGRIAIRDIVMEPDRTQPRMGALFAINMLVNTSGGGTFTFDELREDLEQAGFAGVEWIRHDAGMNSIVTVRKPNQ